MNDAELKEHLLATCPVLPGQENRAWLALKGQLAPRGTRSLESNISQVFKVLAYGGLAALLACGVFNLGVTMRPVHHGLAFADSQVPGIYATAFYSHSAQAQVVWLNGMDPVTDKLTYLDPTTVIKTSPRIDAKNSDQL